MLPCSPTTVFRLPDYYFQMLKRFRLTLSPLEIIFKIIGGLPYKKIR